MRKRGTFVLLMIAVLIVGCRSDQVEQSIEAAIPGTGLLVKVTFADWINTADSDVETGGQQPESVIWRERVPPPPSVVMLPVDSDMQSEKMPAVFVVGIQLFFEVDEGMEGLYYGKGSDETLFVPPMEFYITDQEGQRFPEIGRVGASGEFELSDHLILWSEPKYTAEFLATNAGIAMAEMHYAVFDIPQDSVGLELKVDDLAISLRD
jgi:hypothetical protein